MTDTFFLIKISFIKVREWRYFLTSPDHNYDGFTLQSLAIPSFGLIFSGPIALSVAKSALQAQPSPFSSLYDALEQIKNSSLIAGR